MIPHTDKNAVNAAIKQAIVDAVIWNMVPTEDFKVFVKPDYHTGCWSYRPPHYIYIGDSITELVKDSISENDYKRYIKLFVHHELSHALHTERNFDLIKRMIQQAGCTFGLYNLFEDARIEHIWSRQSGLIFNWSDYEQYPDSTAETPAGLLFLLIQYNINFDTGRIGCIPPFAQDVISFYQQICQCEHSLGLAPLLTEWVEQYGDNADDIPGIKFYNRHHHGELHTTLSLQDEATFLAFSQDTKELQLQSERKTPVADAQAFDPAIGQLSYFINHDHETALDDELISRLSQKMCNAKQPYTSFHYTTTPSKHLSLWRSDINRPQYRHALPHISTIKRLHFIMDCSGSMAGYHLTQGLHLLSVINDLAQQHLLSGYMVLSGVYYEESAGDRAQYATLSLPIDPTLVRYIEAEGHAEGLQNALDQNRQLFIPGDYVYIYTDGNVADRSLVLRNLRQRNIRVLGLYIGNYEDAVEYLTQYFEHFIVRSNVADLVDAIILQS